MEEQTKNDNGFRFSLPIRVGIRDINYGGHVGNDVYLSYCQEVRIAYLRHFDCSELDIGGCGIILVRSELDYKQELFHGDEVDLFCRISSMKNTSFVMEYLIEKDGKAAMTANTVLLAFDYAARKITKVPEAFRSAVTAYESL